MEVGEAIQMIDGALGNLQATRQAHIQLQQALHVVKETIGKDKKKDA
jgi:hypothetical protein